MSTKKISEVYTVHLGSEKAKEEESPKEDKFAIEMTMLRFMLWLTGCAFVLTAILMKFTGE